MHIHKEKQIKSVFCVTGMCDLREIHQSQLENLNLKMKKFF